MTLPPSLSVIVVVGDRRDRIGACLESLLTQDRVEEMEVVVLDLASRPDLPRPHSEHPRVRWLPLPPETLYYQARVRGVEEARAPVVACVEEHVRACPGWAAALLEAHREPWAGVGPQVFDANPDQGKSEVVGLINYGLFAGPAEVGSTHIIPGHNSSYKRQVLLGYGAQLGELLACENVLIRRIVEDGHTLTLAPGARVHHLNEASLGVMARGHFLYHRCYGDRRQRAFGWSRRRRLLYALAAPLIPIYFLVKLNATLRRRGHPRRGLLWRHVPFVYATQLAAACGQALGLLFGPGDADRRFTAYELTAERPGDLQALPACPGSPR